MNNALASRYALFVDGSVNPQSGIGCGAFLLITEATLVKIVSSQSCGQVNKHIKTQRFDKTSSTHLELEALLWALHAVPHSAQLTIYTDCQNIIRLPQRQHRLETGNYTNKRGQQLPLTHLYKRFYQYQNQFGFLLEKLKGHKPQNEKTVMDQLFSLVDKKARTTCREFQTQP